MFFEKISDFIKSYHGNVSNEDLLKLKEVVKNSGFNICIVIFESFKTINAHTKPMNCRIRLWFNDD